MAPSILNTANFLAEAYTIRNWRIVGLQRKGDNVKKIKMGDRRRAKTKKDLPPLNHVDRTSIQNNLGLKTSIDDVETVLAVVKGVGENSRAIKAPVQLGLLRPEKGLGGDHLLRVEEFEDIDTGRNILFLRNKGGHHKGGLGEEAGALNSLNRNGVHLLRVKRPLLVHVNVVVHHSDAVLIVHCPLRHPRLFLVAVRVREMVIKQCGELGTGGGPLTSR